MKQAVIVSTARTGLAKSVRGGFNQTHGAVMGGHAVKHAIERAQIEPDEIVPLATKMKKLDKATGAESLVDVIVDRDECNRPDTTLEGLAALKPVHAGGQQVATGKYITAGNASQFADGASACVLMSQEAAARKGIKPLGIFK